MAQHSFGNLELHIYMHQYVHEGFLKIFSDQTNSLAFTCTRTEQCLDCTESRWSLKDTVEHISQVHCAS